MDWAQILVIILSVLLAMFLILAITLLIVLIRVTKQIKEFTRHASNVAGGIENSILGLTKASTSITVLKKIIRRFSRRK